MKRFIFWSAIAAAIGVFAALYNINFIFISAVCLCAVVIYAIFRTKITLHFLILFLVFAVTFAHSNIRLKNISDLADRNLRVAGTVVSVYRENTQSYITVKSDNKYVLLSAVNSSFDVSPGDTLTAFVRSKPFLHSKDMTKNLSNNISAIAAVNDDAITISGKKTINFMHTVYSLRQYVTSSFRKYIPDSLSSIVIAMFLGDKSYCSDEITKSFASSGISHITAVSGLHLNIMILLIINILKLLKVRSKILRYVLCIIFAWIFAAVSGASLSVVRAAIMFTLTFIARLVRRESDALTSLGAALLIIIAISPFSVLDIGFQLSVLSTMSLIIFGKYFILLINTNRFISNTLSASLAAQIGTIPLCIFYFSGVSLIAPVTNLLIFPLVTVIMFLALTLCFVSFIPIIAGSVGVLISLPVFLLKYIALYLSSLPFAFVKIRWLGIPELILYAILCIFLYFKLVSLQKTHENDILNI